MHCRIGLVGKLAEDDGARSGVLQGLRPGDGALHSFRAGSQFQGGAQGLQQPAPLDAHRVGHREDDLVSLGRPDPREADAGIAAGRLDDGGALLQDALRFGVLDHREGDAVLDASAGVEVFEFEKNVGLLAFEPGNPEKRSLSDKLGKGGVNHIVKFK